MDVKRVRRQFRILVVSSLLAVILLILNGYRFPNAEDPTRLIAWKKTPSQQGARGVMRSQARDHIADQTRKLVESKHPSYDQYIKGYKYDSTEKYTIKSKLGIPPLVPSETSQLTGNKLSRPTMDNIATGIATVNKTSCKSILGIYHPTNFPTNGRNQREGHIKDDYFKYNEAPKDATPESNEEGDFYDSESSVSHSVLTESDANSNFLKELLIAEEHTGETEQHHYGKSSVIISKPATEPFRSKVAVDQRKSRRMERPRNPSFGRNTIATKEEHIRQFLSKNTSPQIMFTMKEDVVMESLPKYTNMPPVSEREFLQLKADGNLRRNISRTLFNMAPEVFLKTPLTFSPQTRGPCWFVNDVSSPHIQRMRCLPYFYVMGMPKCGTTDLYAKIVLHPSVVFLHKEPHWWTRCRFGKGMKGLTREVSYDDYLHHYDGVVKAIYKKRKPEIIVGGDGSASTMWYGMPALGVEDQTDFLALPNIIHEIQPKVKLIAMLREPVQRLYSDYMYFHRKKVDARDFHHLVKTSISRFKRCTKVRSPSYCARKPGSAQEARLTLGLYSVFLVDWLKVFPRDRILILRLRDWKANCLTLLPEIYAFLELETLSDKGISLICNSGVRNVNSKKKFPMLNTTAEILTDFYRPYNKDLAALLQDDRFLWLD